MKHSKVTFLSTGHLHPHEAQKLDEISYFADKHGMCSFFSTESDMIQFYEEKGFYILCDVLREVKEKYDSDYVLFDPDIDLSSDFRNFVW